MNVVTGERYTIVSDELIAYAAGHYGEPPAPIEPDVLDRIMSAPRAPAIAASPPEQPTLEELRKRYGTDDDDLLILKALIPESAIEAMQAAGPVERDFLQRHGSLEALSSPEIDEVSELIASARTPYVRVATEAWEVELRRG